MDSGQRTVNFYKAIGAVGMAARTNSERTALTLREIKRLFKKDQKLLDLACGYGRITIPLAKQGYTVAGADISPDLIKEAKRKKADISFKVADMRKLPYKEGSFDGVLCLWSAFNELLIQKDQLAAVKSIHAVLKPGGMALIDMPELRETQISKDKWRVAKRVVTGEIEGVKHSSYQHDKRSLNQLMQKAGIERYKVVTKSFAGRRRLLLIFWK